MSLNLSNKDLINEILKKTDSATMDRFRQIDYELKSKNSEKEIIKGQKDTDIGNLDKDIKKLEKDRDDLIGRVYYSE